MLLDSNVALRYVLEDNAAQARAVCDAVARGGACVTIEVLSECAYVLRGVYGVPRSDVVESLSLLLEDVSCDRWRVAACALGLYSVSSLDFVDCVLAAEHDVSGRDIMTFDKKLNTMLRRLDDTALWR